MNAYLRHEYGKIGEPLPLEALQVPQVERDDGGEAANFGVSPEASYLDRPHVPNLGEAANHILAVESKDTALWPALFLLFPHWRWGLQATGDCTGWMQEHLLDMLKAILWHNGKISKPRAQTAGEATYAFSKCELYNSYRYHGAGSTGWAVASACVKFGHLERIRYTVAGAVYDLTRYHGDYSVRWGDKGAGVPDRLEPIAAKHKTVDRLNPANAFECAKLIAAGYPVQYCGYTTWARERNRDGVGTRFSSGWHAMTLTGVRWDGDKPLCFWNANTGHGNHCLGPVGPFPVPDVYAQCGAWIPASLVDRVARAGDCHAHTFVEGWPILDLPDWGGGEVF